MASGIKAPSGERPAIPSLRSAAHSCIGRWRVLSRLSVRRGLPRALRLFASKRLQRGEQAVHARIEEVGIRPAEADLALPIQDEERAGAHPEALPIHAVQARDPTP